MTTKYVLGIDCGNTAVKAAVFDCKGREIGSRAERVETRFPQPGHSETDMIGLWHKCASVVAAALTELNIPPEDVLAVGVSGHGNGAYLLDNNREPLRAIQSLDSRAEAQVNQDKTSQDYPRLSELNRQGVWPSQTATLLKWLKHNEPATYSNIGVVLFCKDYINFCLTGECHTEYGDLSASGLYDYTSGDVSSDLLSLLGIEEMKDRIPTTLWSENTVGHITRSASEQTRLPVGTPVVGGFFDVIASAVGSGVWDTADASLITGTWSINQVVSDTIPHPDIFMSSVFPGGRYMAMENSATSASNLEWFVSEFFAPEKQVAQSLGKSVFEFCNNAVENVKLAENLPLFHPYLYGSSDLASAGANFFGLAGWHTKSDLLYAVYEGIVFGHLEHFLKLNKAGLHFDNAVLSGGGARSEFWCQLFADVLDIRIAVTPCGETGARGAAMAAAYAGGVYETFQDAVRNMSGEYRYFHPDKTKQPVLKARFERYQAVSTFINSGI
ncbi:carbohydrate kinase [Parasalinivibrio latis]|uniref:FGGY-family carbohydrate kinase n=1 Tax=Parasalinivibrio latis TaxID=2952610 RepID=UPI0030E36EDF